MFILLETFEAKSCIGNKIQSRFISKVASVEK